MEILWGSDPVTLMTSTFLLLQFVCSLAPQEFEMDKQIIEDLKQQRQDRLDAVSREMAFEEEKCRITLQKVESRFVKFSPRTGDCPNNVDVDDDDSNKIIIYSYKFMAIKIRPGKYFGHWIGRTPTPLQNVI